MPISDKAMWDSYVIIAKVGTVAMFVMGAVFLVLMIYNMFI